jgi:NADH:ubiquinone oxidoreductase subunit
MTFKEILLRSLTWWNGQTWGTYFYTRRKGQLVGTDDFGNQYYRAWGHQIDPSMGHERRWVIYNGVTEPSRVPPSWRSWLTYTHDVPPSEEHYVPRAWEKEPLANMTGTPYAYRPQGSTNASGERPPATGDYVPWTPAGWSGEHDVVQPNAHPGTHGVGLKQPMAG